MKESPKINYLSPEDSTEEGGLSQHRFDLVIDGKKIGAAEMDYFSKPLPLYQITDLYVDFEEKGKGYASKILDQIEDFLEKRRRPGVLVDAIMIGDPASGMYGRRGWKSVQGSVGLYVYNWPEDVSLDKLQGYQFRHTDVLGRGK